MFKKFFSFISNKIKGFVNKIRKSKTVKTITKVLGLAGSACVVVTAFRMGNIADAVSHMSKTDVSFGDTVRWFLVMCGDFIKDIRNKDINWGVRNIFMPFVGAVAYCGNKILKKVTKIYRWVKTHKIVSTIPKVVPIKKKPSAEVVNVF